MNVETYSVLLADDSALDRFFLKEAITRGAPRLRVVGEVGDGDQVLAYLTGRGSYSDREKHPLPDLLILDSRMPCKDGLEVLRWLQTQNFLNLRVALFADTSGTGLQTKALELGASFFFSKLISKDELVRAVRALQFDLERGKRMKVMLQHASTRRYFQAVDRWTPFLHEGMEFKSVTVAADFARQQNLAEIARIALLFIANGQTFYFPIQLPGEAAGTPMQAD